MISWWQPIWSVLPATWHALRRLDYRHISRSVLKIDRLHQGGLNLFLQTMQVSWSARAHVLQREIGHRRTCTHDGPKSSVSGLWRRPIAGLFHGHLQKTGLQRSHGPRAPDNCNDGRQQEMRTSSGRNGVPGLGFPEMP